MILEIGLVATGGGVLFLVGGWNDRQRAREILATPTRAIAHATGEGRVEVCGRVVADEHTVATPFTRRRVVWQRVRVEVQGHKNRWSTIIEEVTSVRFLVDDESGPPARVEADDAWMVLDPETVTTSGTFEDPTPDALAYLAMHGQHSTFLGFNRKMRYSEEVLLPGDTVFALGPSRRDPDGRLVLYAERRNDLIVTNKPEEELVSRLQRSFWLMVIGFAIGLPLSLVGALLR